MTPQRTTLFAALAAWTLLLGCAIRPEGEKHERDRIALAGQAYEEAVPVPELPEAPGPEDLLRRAFLANAALKARYLEWRAAIEQVPQDASPPNAALTFSYLFDAGMLKSWDRTTLGITNDPMANIPFPSKLSTAGRRALEVARAAGLRFEEAKFLLQKDVLTTWLDLALLSESIRIQDELSSVLRLIEAQTSARVESGSAGQQDFLRARTELDLATNDLLNLRSRVPALVARLNALLDRPPGAPISLPPAIPAPRPLPVEDDDLLRLGAERSPALAALVREIAGSREELHLRKQDWFPDFGLNASNTGDLSRTLGGMLVLPTRVEAIRAGIRQAEAGLGAAEALRIQYANDLAASFVLNLAVLRNDERQAALFDEAIVPRARQTVQILLTAYSAGRAGFTDLLDAERTLLEARLALARVRIEREKALVAIETFAAIDVEAIDPLAGR